MKQITIDGINYVCEVAKVATKTTKLEFLLIAIVVILVVIGLVIGFRKLKKIDEEEYDGIIRK